MALVLADRVKETSTTTGTGTYTLAGAVSGFETFGSIGNGNTTYYACTLGADFEVGIGTYTSSGTTLARTTILQSSNSDNAVDWGAGTKTLFCTQPAEKAVFLNASDNIELADDEKIILGTNSSTDVEISHNGSNFLIAGGSSTIISTFGVNIAKFGTGGSSVGAELYYGGLDRVETTADGVSITGDLTLTSTADSGAVLKLVSNDPADAADFGIEGQVQFFAENSASESTQYYSLQMKTADVTDGTEDGWLYLNATANGSHQQANAFANDGSFYFLGNGHASNAVIKWYQTRGTSHNVSLAVATPTADRTITLPDATGTVLTTSNSDSPTTTTSSGDADFVLIDDGGTMKKITPANLGVGGGSGISAVVDDTSPQLGGNLDSNDKNILLGDSTSDNSFVNRIKLGAGNDLQLFHSGTGSFISDTGTGSLFITGSNTITFQSGDYGETYATFNDDGAVTLRHNDSIKFSTTSTGAEVTGDLTLTSTDAGATENPTLDLYRNSASPAANDVIGHIDFSGEDSAGNKDVYAKINVDIIDPTSGSEDARLDLGVVSNGTVANRIVMTGNGSTQIQNASLLLAQSVDLIFEGATNDGNETTLTVTDPTSDRTITLPDQTGTAMVAVFYDSYLSSNQTLSSSYSTIDFDTNRQNSDAAVFSESAGEVTVAKAGVYLFSFQLTIGNTSTSRSEGISRLQRKPSGGDFAEVAGSTAKTYHRNNSQDGSEGSVSLMYSVTAGDVFRVQAKRNSGGGDLVADGNGCRFNIMALKIG